MPMRGAQNQPRMRMPGDGLEDLVRLLDRESGILLQQSCSMPKRNIQCSNGLRSAVQLSIQSIPADCYGLIRISRRRFVKSATGVGAHSGAAELAAQNLARRRMSRQQSSPKLLINRYLYIEATQLVPGRRRAAQRQLVANCTAFRDFFCHTIESSSSGKARAAAPPPSAGQRRAAAGVYPGPRNTCPGLAPVILPSAITGTPLTSTQRMPTANSFGALKVERSAMVSRVEHHDVGPEPAFQHPAIGEPHALRRQARRTCGSPPRARGDALRARTCAEFSGKSRTRAGADAPRPKFPPARCPSCHC